MNLKIRLPQHLYNVKNNNVIKNICFECEIKLEIV